MPDEIDLLRTFRSDTPGPDEGAWAAARGAIAAVAEPGPPAGRPLPRLRPWGNHRPRIQRRTAVIAGGIAVAAAVTAGVLVSVLPGSSGLGPAPTLHKALTSGWEPARALPSGTAAPQGPSGQWQLAGYLSPRSWQQTSRSPEQPGDLTCPTARTCYVTGNGATSASGPDIINALYVSGDGARTWSVLPVPAGVTFTSPLACTTESDCTAGGLFYGHQGVYLATANGGHSWTVTPLKAGADKIIRLACPSATTCRGLLETGGAGPWGPVDALRVKLISTADGGRHFTTSSFPAGMSMGGLSCPTAAHCVALGIVLPRPDAPLSYDDSKPSVVLVTDNGGASWQRVPLPGFVGILLPKVTCSDAAHCALLGYVIGKVAVKQPDGSTAPDQWSVVGFSADGGQTWKIRTLPKSIPGPFLNDLACPTTTECYVSGVDDVTRPYGPGTDDGENADVGSAVIAVTRDEGRTWQQARFAIPLNTPGRGDVLFNDIGEIQCPQAGTCVVLGIYAQGSKATVPVYALHG